MIEPERLDYPLAVDSLVWDVGAYMGEFSAAILEKFACRIMAFEPMPGYSMIACQACPQAKIYSFGLAERDFELQMTAAGDRTSIYPQAVSLPEYRAAGTVLGIFRDVISVLDEHDIKSIDLAKINIEGGEYALLRRLIDSGYIDRFRYLQVQFHTFMPSFGELYLALKRDLERTHTLQWRWPWRWESWQRKA